MFRTRSARASLRRSLKGLSFAIHRILLRFGIFLLPVHYYASVSSLIELQESEPTWARKSALPGMSIDLEGQISALKRMCRPFQHEYLGNRAYQRAVEASYGPGYGYIEAQALHAVIRHTKPARVLEVGSGVSTYCMHAAMDQNASEGQPGQITCIDPNPSSSVLALEGIRIVQRQVQRVSLDEFTRLKAGDFLFIDSTHTVRPGSDVNFLILEVLPRLAAGVIVHFHDIFLPYDFQRDVLRTYFQWMETSLLRAFLTNNNRARILFCLSLLHYDHPEALREVFPEYVPAADRNGLDPGTTPGAHFPSSIFIEMT